MHYDKQREAKVAHDNINNPKHYTKHPSGVECIQITEHFNFCLGNAIKYIWRAGLKNDREEDLRKAMWYLQRELKEHSKTQEQKVEENKCHDLSGLCAPSPWVYPNE